MAKIAETEAVIKIKTTTGTELTYKLSRENGAFTVTREISVSPDGSEVETTIEDIESDARALKSVAAQFRIFLGLPIDSL